MWRYRKHVERDLERWHQAGWVTDDGLAAIQSDLASDESGFNYIGSFAVLGGILIAFAAMSFVAANWQEMPRLARLVLLLATMWAAYGGAAMLHDKAMPRFADAAVLTGCAMFGASIMLIAQMFHIDGHPPDAVLMWMAGTLLAGVVLRSTPALGLAMLLALLWGGWEQSLIHQVFWWFLPVWAAISAAYWWLGWRPGLHFSSAALALFVAAAGYIYERHTFNHEVVVVVAIAFAAAALFARRALPRALEDETSVVLEYAIVTAFAGLWALQFFNSISTEGLIAYAAFTLALLAAAIYWASQNGEQAVLRLAYAGFTAEVLGLYFKTVGTLLGSSLFFLVAGLLIIALAAGAYKLNAYKAVGEAN